MGAFSRLSCVPVWRGAAWATTPHHVAGRHPARLRTDARRHSPQQASPRRGADGRPAHRAGARGGSLPSTGRVLGAIAGRRPRPLCRPLVLPTIPDDVEARFWPRWSHDDGRVTEPDVVLRWPGALVSVEVKCLSGKSSTASEDRGAVTDQFHRQLMLAERHAAAEGWAWGVGSTSPQARLVRVAVGRARWQRST